MAFGNDDYYVGLAWSEKPDGMNGKLIKAQLGDRRVMITVVARATDGEIERLLRDAFRLGNSEPAPAPKRARVAA